VRPARAGTRQVKEADRAGLRSLAEVEDLDAGRPQAGPGHLVGDHQQAVPERQRVRPDITVRQRGLGQQLRRRRVRDVEHAEVRRPLLVSQVQVPPAAVLQQRGALAAVTAAAQIVLAEQPHPVAFLRRHSHPSGRPGLLCWCNHLLHSIMPRRAVRRTSATGRQILERFPYSLCPVMVRLITYIERLAAGAPAAACS